jgi:hypothetical protein
MPGPSEDRYEPLPGLLGLPAFLFRKLSLRGRRLAIVLGVVAAAGLAAFALFAWPAIEETKDERAAKEARRLAEARAARDAELREEQTVMRDRARIAGLTGSPAEAIAAREVLINELEDSVEADARRRVEEGRLEKPILHAECDPFPKTDKGEPPVDDPNARRGPYECVAVTAVIHATENNVGGVIGYPFRALVHFRSGRYAWCKISGQPGEGAFDFNRKVGVPRECGGQGPEGDAEG